MPDSLSRSQKAQLFLGIIFRRSTKSVTKNLKWTVASSYNKACLDKNLDNLLDYHHKSEMSNSIDCYYIQKKHRDEQGDEGAAKKGDEGAAKKGDEGAAEAGTLSRMIIKELPTKSVEYGCFTQSIYGTDRELRDEIFEQNNTVQIWGMFKEKKKGMNLTRNWHNVCVIWHNNKAYSFDFLPGPNEELLIESPSILFEKALVRTKRKPEDTFLKLLATGKLIEESEENPEEKLNILKNQISGESSMLELNELGNYIIKGYTEYTELEKSDLEKSIDEKKHVLSTSLRKKLEKVRKGGSNNVSEIPVIGDYLKFYYLKGDLTDDYTYKPYIIDSEGFYGEYDNKKYMYTDIETNKSTTSPIKTNCMGMLQRLFPHILGCKFINTTIPECKPKKKCFKAHTTESAPADEEEPAAASVEEPVAEEPAAAAEVEESAATKSVAPSAQLLTSRSSARRPGARRPGARRPSYIDAQKLAAAGKKRKQSKKYKNKNRKKNNISQKKKRKN